MLEKDKAMFMAVLNSEREISLVASQNNRATAFWKATVDPLDETYYAVRGGKHSTSAEPAQVALESPTALLRPQQADNIKGKGISFKQAAGQPDYSATLIEAGFTDDVIAAMKADAGNTYGVELVDEALKTVEYLEKQVADGAKISSELVEEAITTCHPGGSGSSSLIVKSWIADNWRYGDKVYNAYGQRAPGQAVLSKGNIKAKYNKVKHSISETIEYAKFNLGIDDTPVVKPRAEAAVEPAKIIEPNTATVKTISEEQRVVINKIIEDCDNITEIDTNNELSRIIRQYDIEKYQSKDGRTIIELQKSLDGNIFYAEITEYGSPNVRPKSTIYDGGQKYTIERASQEEIEKLNSIISNSLNDSSLETDNILKRFLDIYKLYPAQVDILCKSGRPLSLEEIVSLAPTMARDQKIIKFEK